VRTYLLRAPDRGSRARVIDADCANVAGPLAAINPGDERSITVTRGHPAAQVKPHSSPDRTDSQADSAGSIPVTRSKRERAARALFSGRSSEWGHDASPLSRARCVPDWERSASARLLISSAIILSRSDVRCW